MLSVWSLLDQGPSNKDFKFLLKMFFPHNSQEENTYFPLSKRHFGMINKKSYRLFREKTLRRVS